MNFPIGVRTAETRYASFTLLFAALGERQSREAPQLRGLLLATRELQHDVLAGRAFPESRAAVVDAVAADAPQSEAAVLLAVEELSAEGVVEREKVSGEMLMQRH